MRCLLDRMQSIEHPTPIGERNYHQFPVEYDTINSVEAIMILKEHQK